MLATTREDLEVRKEYRPLKELEEQAAAYAAGKPAARSLLSALGRPGTHVIAEIKRASPSKGDINPDVDVAATAALYERAGAAAISVLTEERHFRGSIDDLKAARAASGLPILRKDFIIDRYQLAEAAAAGADAVLLIVAALPLKDLRSLYDRARVMGLDCLVEVHDAEELQGALALGARIIGINNRDLRTFKVSLETTLNLIESVPDDRLVVSESGIRGSADVSLLARAGVKAILVGEALMSSGSPADKLKELLS